MRFLAVVCVLCIGFLPAQGIAKLVIKSLIIQKTADIALWRFARLATLMRKWRKLIWVRVARTALPATI